MEETKTQETTPAADPMQTHLQEVVRQGMALQQEKPEFQMGQELKNELFVRMTHPLVGASVADAYEMITTMRARQNRPVEAGLSGQSANVATFHWRQATPAQRQAQRKAIRDAAARGQKLYPGKFV